MTEQMAEHRIGTREEWFAAREELLVRANWWIPRWLDDRLPRFDVDRAVAAPEKA